MKDIIKIVIGNVCITTAYAFITVPNQMVNGGVTSFSMILSKFLPVDISVLTNATTLLLLAVCFWFLGKEFLMKSLLSSICYMLFFSYFHGLSLVFPCPLLPAILIASVMVGIGYFLCISAHSSTVGFDVLALVIHKKNPKADIAITMRYINIGVILLGLASYGVLSIVIGIIFTFLQTQTLHMLLKWQEKKESLSCVSTCITK